MSSKSIDGGGRNSATDSPQPTAHAPEAAGMGRRDYLERVGVTAGTLVTLGAGGHKVAPQFSPIGRAQAIAPAAIVAYAGVSASIGWALRDAELLGSDDVPDGLSAGALESQILETARARKSNNESTFIDNENIVEGINHAAHGDGKIAGIEALNDQESQSDVQDAAVSGAEDYETTVKLNLLKSWNESLEEMDNLIAATEEHSDVDEEGFIEFTYDHDMAPWPAQVNLEDETLDINGEEFDVHQLQGDGASSSIHNPTTEYEGDDYRVQIDGGEVVYHEFEGWSNIWNEIDETFQEVKDGLITWVDGVYDDIQAGELDTEELLTPRELAEMTADDEEFNQAVADLMALNVAVDLEREAEIYLESMGATVYGSLGITDDVTIEAGDEIDPDAEDEDYYLTYDISEGHGEWAEYDDEKGVDGGVIHFTDEPFEDTVFEIETTAGETVEVVTDDFTAYDSNDEELDDLDDEDADYWEVDVSDDLDDAVTDVEAIEFRSESDETQYETVLLQDTFELVTFTDSDGEEHDSVDYTSGEAHDDENYITQEEWEEQQERHEELIEQYEENDDDGVTLPGMPGGDLGDYSGAFAGVAIIGAAILAVVGFATDLLPWT